MNKTKFYINEDGTYKITWVQEYVTWEQISSEPELDLTEARAVLARIMAL